MISDHSNELMKYLLFGNTFFSLRPSFGKVSDPQKGYEIHNDALLEDTIGHGFNWSSNKRITINETIP